MTGWLRLWHDMPTDPKWRAIARRSGQRVTDVIAVYVLMMTTASQSDDRGSIAEWSDEDAAACLDLDEEAVASIRTAMEGKVIEGRRLSGWEKIREPRESDRPPLSVWRGLRASVFKRDDYTCAYCGERAGRLECDHIIPVSRGGSHNESNLTTACFACNRAKRDKTPQEWLG